MDKRDQDEQVKRKNHYVPVCHLRRFTPSGTDDGAIWALNVDTGKQWRSAASSVAYESYLYHVRVPGYSPNHIEEWLSREIEGPATQIFDWIEDHKQIPEGEGFARLMVYVAIQAVRIPAFRNAISELIDNSARLLMQMVLDTPERWAAQLEKMKAAGKEPPKGADYEKLKAFVDAGEFTIQSPPEIFLRNMIEVSRSIVPRLLERNWSLWISDGRGQGFICSDRPVTLNSLTPQPPGTGPGHGMPGTILTMPLSRRIALEGRFEGDSRVSRADERMVAIINGCTARNAARFLFLTDEDFVWSPIDAKGILRKDSFLESRRST